MGFLGAAFSKVASFIDSIAEKIPSFSSDTGQLSSSIATVNTCLQKMNKYFPCDTLCTVIGLVIGIYIVLNAFYWIQRVINLLRGSG